MLYVISYAGQEFSYGLTSRSNDNEFSREHSTCEVIFHILDDIWFANKQEDVLKQVILKQPSFELINIFVAISILFTQVAHGNK